MIYEVKAHGWVTKAKRLAKDVKSLAEGVELWSFKFNAHEFDVLVIDDPEQNGITVQIPSHYMRLLECMIGYKHGEHVNVSAFSYLNGDSKDAKLMVSATMKFDALDDHVDDARVIERLNLKAGELGYWRYKSGKAYIYLLHNSTLHKELLV